MQMKKISPMNKEREKEESKHKCEEVKIAELSERIAKLEKDLQKQNKQDKQTKFLSKVIFFGAVASGFNAIVSVCSMIIH
jgi:ribosomal protein S15P/S13E